MKLKTIHRDSQGRGQVAPLRHDEVERICWEARKDENRLAGLRDIALVRTMRDGLLQISERVAVDVEHLQDKSLWIPRSKTDQEGEGVFLYLTQKTRKAIAEYSEAAGILSGALFCTVFKHSKRRLGKWLDTGVVRKIIKDRAKAFENRMKMQLFMPSQNYVRAMAFTQQEWDNPQILSHIFHGLSTEELITNMHYGPQEFLKKTFNDVPSDGIICAPTALGAELLLWAFGHGDKGLDFLLTGDFSPKIEGIPNSVPNALATADTTNTSS